MNILQLLMNIILIILTAVFWRMGGASGYNKLWRRVGSALLMWIIIWCNNG